MWILDILVFNLFIVFLVELSLGYLFGARTFKKTISVLLINVITNPAIVLTMLFVTMFYNSFETTALVILELMVFILEGFLFSKFNIFKKPSPYLASLILNLSSFLVGNIIKIFL